VRSDNLPYSQFSKSERLSSYESVEANCRSLFSFRSPNKQLLLPPALLVCSHNPSPHTYRPLEKFDILTSLCCCSFQCTDKGEISCMYDDDANHSPVFLAPSTIPSVQAMHHHRNWNWGFLKYNFIFASNVRWASVGDRGNGCGIVTEREESEIDDDRVRFFLLNVISNHPVLCCGISVVLWVELSVIL
jgi:hypothetical protein